MTNMRHYMDAVSMLCESAEVDPTANPKFRTWFGDSKVVDAQGKPLVVYHGTGTKFTSFDTKRSIGSQFWFTNSRDKVERGEVGANASGVILEVYLSIQNPVGWDEYEKLLIGQIRSRGHDGIILADGDEKTYVVFDPRQIKSIHNRTFNPRTRHMGR
jgi:hypothetical protein